MKLIHRVTASEAGLTAEGLLRKTMGFSRAMVRKLKRYSGVIINGQPAYLSRRLKEGDDISIDLRPGGNAAVQPQPIPIDILYEDPHLLVVNKPPNMLVHPLKHEPYNTLANAILYHYRRNNTELTFRPVTRLDRNTSGLVVVAKHAHAGFRLAQQLHTSELQREYLAVVHGTIAQARGTIDFPIARCPDSKIKQMVHPEGRRAVTHYCVEKYLAGGTLVKLRLATGRTHQIRVHMSHIGHPLVGDTLYGGREEGINRQALHCYKVKLTHPVTGELLVMEAPLPGDMRDLINNA